MNRKMTLLAPAFFLMLPVGVAFADAHQDAEMCNSMLATSVGMELATEGFTMVNACDLTVSQLAQIKNLLDTEGMNARVRIQAVLDGE